MYLLSQAARRSRCCRNNPRAVPSEASNVDTGVLGSDATPSAGPSVTGSGRPGSVATASDSEGEGSGDGSSLAAARLSKTAPASPTTVLSGSPSVAVPSPGDS